MAILGAHMSIAGGYYRAVESANQCRCDCVQLFTKNNNQWRAKPIDDDDVEKFQSSLAKWRIQQPISHSSYLINLASPEQPLRKKSIDGMVVELQRADQLGIEYVVLHPGAFIRGSEQTGIKRIVRSLDEIHRQTLEITAKCLLETTAGQGTNLGWRFEQLAEILAGARDPDRLGVCLDTCHVFAAGYAMSSQKEYKATMSELQETVGIDQIKAIHLNDSKRELGSRVDRHEHIGQGHLGLAPFRHLLTDRRFRRVPMYLETPKGETNGKSWDVANLRKLRRLVPKK